MFQLTLRRDQVPDGLRWCSTALPGFDKHRLDRCLSMTVSGSLPSVRKPWLFSFSSRTSSPYRPTRFQGAARAALFFHEADCCTETALRHRLSFNSPRHCILRHGQARPVTVGKHGDKLPNAALQSVLCREVGLLGNANENSLLNRPVMIPK